MFEVDQKVTYQGRPAVVTTAPDEGATGATVIGVRFLDVERLTPYPGIPGMMRPTPGSMAIARVEDLR